MNIRTSVLRIASAVLLAVCLAAAPGCESVDSVRRAARKISRDISAPTEDLRKGAAIIRITNRTFYTGDDFASFFTDRLVQTAKGACADVEWMDPQVPRLALALRDEAPPHHDNVALARFGRKLGLAAVAVAEVTDISGNEEERGILWMKDEHAFLTVHARVAVYDTETAAKLLDAPVVHELEVDEAVFEDIRQRRISGVDPINAVLATAAGDLGQRVCDAVYTLPWKGYILAREGSRVLIAEGRKAGLKTGMLLDVYDDGGLIQGVDGQAFFLPGKRTARVRVTAVRTDSCDAEPVDGTSVGSGYIVRLPK